MPMYKKTHSHVRLQDAITEASARGVPVPAIAAAMGVPPAKIGKVLPTIRAREDAIVAVQALQPAFIPASCLPPQPDQPISLIMKPLPKEIIAALEDSTIRTVTLNHPDGRKERIAIQGATTGRIDRAKEGSERTVVVQVNSNMDKTMYETIRDDLVKGFADAAKGMKKAAEGMAEVFPKKIPFPKAKESNRFATGGVVSAEAVRLGTIAHESIRKVGKAAALGTPYKTDMPDGFPVHKERQTRRVLTDGTIVKMIGETRISTSPPLPPAKPAHTLQKVWPIGMGLLGTAYKEYD